MYFKHETIMFKYTKRRTAMNTNFVICSRLTLHAQFNPFPHSYNLPCLQTKYLAACATWSAPKVEMKKYEWS